MAIVTATGSALLAGHTTASATDVELAFAYLRGKQEQYDLLWSYYNGAHPIVYNASKLREIFGEIDAAFNENWCNVVVDAVLDRIGIAGFAVGQDERRGEALLQLWRDSGLDLDSVDAHLCALVTGEAFVVCGVTEDGTPEAYYNDSRLCHMFYDPARPRVARMAAKWWDELVGPNKLRARLTLYYPDRLEHYVAQTRRAEVMHAAAFQPLPDMPVEANPWGEIPVFHIRREQRAVVSELVNIIPLQAQLNKVLADMMIAAEFGAFRQRYIISQMAGNQRFRNAPNEIWSLPAAMEGEQATTVGEFSATDLGNYLAAIERSANTIATVAGIPRALLQASGDVPSGAALRALEAPLVKKAERYMARWEPAWRGVLRWLLRMTGGGEVDAHQIDVLWAAAGTSTPEDDAATVETLVKAGMPLVTALRRQGWSDAELAALEEDQAAQEQRQASLASAYMAAAESNANRAAARAGDDAGEADADGEA